MTQISVLKSKQVNSSLRKNVLIATFMLSVLVVVLFAYLEQNQRIRLIRMQQTYGFLSLLYWYVVFLATPLSKLVLSNFMAKYLHARRALGVSVAYFALLHSLIAFFGQLGGIAGISSYPARFAVAMTLGAVGLFYLLFMAATSFDKMIDALGKKRWIALHRISYILSYLVFIHVWIVGTHLKYIWVQITFGLLFGFLLGLEAWRVALRIPASGDRERPWKKWIVFSIAWCALLLCMLSIPILITSYSDLHSGVGGH